MILLWETWSTRTETCPIAALSTTNSTQTDLRLNPGLCDEWSLTNNLSHGMPHRMPCYSVILINSSPRKECEFSLPCNKVVWSVSGGLWYK